MSADTVQTATITTRVPARLDRLPWSRFHWRIIIGLGTVWILDGLEVTMVGSVAERLTESGSGITISAGQIGVAAAIYVLGACLGALFFGQLTDRLGRKKLFLLTLVVYIVATIATAFSFAPWYFYLARFVTGSGIGGEYAAINSAIDELIPARARGRVDLVINGTYWLGAAGGSALALVLLNEAIFASDIGWRIGFGFGAVLGLTILLVRRHVPESPRWLFIHGREEEAERIVGDIEGEVVEQTGTSLDEPESSITVRQRTAIPFRMIARTAFKLYPHRAILGLALFVGQAFIYNAFTFNLGSLLGTFYGVASGTVPVFLIIWALANFAGPVTLGRLFDTVGRKPMISGCYLGSTLLTIPLIFVFLLNNSGAWVFLAFLVAIFFLASSGASAAYLTVSEIFPMETRALAIAFFYAVGTAIGGITGPLLFGKFIGSGDRQLMSIGLVIGAVAMALGGVAELLFGVKAERANLEEIAKPLTAQEAEEPAEPGDGQVEASARPRTEEATVPAAEPVEGAAGLPADGALNPHRQEARQRREEAEHQRSRADEHRAAALEAGALADGRRDSDPTMPRSSPESPESPGERARAEESLAEAADLRASALEEQATAEEESATADEASEENLASAARSRGQAARMRSDALEEREQALAARDDAEAATFAARADAAEERSRAQEQRALAAQCRADAGQHQGPDAEVCTARATMHEEWARMHDLRAEAHRARSEADEDGTRQREEQASRARSRALAAEQRVSAAEHQAAAADVRGERESVQQTQAQRTQAQRTQAQRTQAQQDEAEERRAREEQLDRRIRERVARRESRARTGLRRLRPGPGSRLQAGRSGGLDPRVTAGAEQALDREIDVLARALDERGPTDRRDLARMVGARYWGPGRFGAALREAVEEGRARQLSPRTYGPPEREGS